MPREPAGIVAEAPEVDYVSNSGALSGPSHILRSSEVGPLDQAGSHEQRVHQIEDRVDALQRTGALTGVQSVTTDDFYVWPDPLITPHSGAYHDPDSVSAVQELWDQPAADISGATGDKHGSIMCARAGR